MAGLEQRVGLYQASHEKLGGLTAELVAERARVDALKERVAALGAEAAAAREEAAEHTRRIAELEAHDAAVDALRADLRSAASSVNTWRVSQHIVSQHLDRTRGHTT